MFKGFAQDRCDRGGCGAGAPSKRRSGFEISPHEEKMMARPNLEISLRLLRWMFRWSVEKVSPYNGGNSNPTYLLDDLWKEHPSILGVLPHLLPQLGTAIWLRSIKRFCLKMALA